MSLLIDVLRHGVSEPSHALGDFHRALTRDGERAIERLGEQLRVHPERPARVFSSPLRRAQQTARLICRELGVAVPVEELSELEPERDPGEVARILATLVDGDGHVLLVSHQPLVGSMLSRFTGVSGQRVAPGTLNRLRCEDGPTGHGRLILTLEAT